MAKGLRVIDDDRIRAGDPLATADAIKAIYDGVLALQNRLAANAIVWETVEYDAADFDTDGGTWTVSAADMFDYKIARLGADLLVVQFTLLNTSTGAGTHAVLRMRLPKGLLVHPTANHNGYLTYSDDGAAYAVGLVNAAASDPTRLSLYKMPLGAAWTANANNSTVVRGAIVMQLAPVAGN